jgi:hypothetical protein
MHTAETYRVRCCRRYPNLIFSLFFTNVFFLTLLSSQLSFFVVYSWFDRLLWGYFMFFCVKYTNYYSRLFFVFFICRRLPSRTRRFSESNFFFLQFFFAEMSSFCRYLLLVVFRCCLFVFRCLYSEYLSSFWVDFAWAIICDVDAGFVFYHFLSFSIIFFSNNFE